MSREPRASAQDLRAAVESNPGWYHTIDLGGDVTTPGYIDLRQLAPDLLPNTMRGRALDVGTFDGFWAFEMERRGADVVALDLDALQATEWSPLARPALERVAVEMNLELGRGFRIASEALRSAVDRVICPVYDLTPERIGGPVDLALVGALLLHLRDPVRALEAVRGALRPGGRLLILEPIDVLTSLLSPRRPYAHLRIVDTEFDWWVPNQACLRAWVLAAGFSEVRRGGLFRPPARGTMSGARYLALSARA